MVHALTQIHRLLVPSGVLVDIHPAPQPMQYEVRVAGRVVFSNPELDFCADGYLHAQEALDEVVRRGLFTSDGVREFDFFVFGSSASELRAYLEQINAFEGEPDDPDLVRRGAELERSLQAALDSAGGMARLATHEVAILSTLRAVR